MILQDQPDEVFGIPTIVNTILVDEIPKAAWNKVRNPISNILAEGARKTNGTGTKQDNTASLQQQ